MDKEINKEVMADLFDSLLGAFENEKTERVSQIKESIKALNLDWKRPEDIEVMHINRLLEHIDVMVAETYPDVTKENLHKIQFVYKHYSFLDNNVESMADLGHGCSADKSRWIIGAYINYLVNGKEIIFPARTDKAHSYYHPDFGTFKEWYDFVDGLISLYYRGIAKSNMENTLNLIKKQSAAKEEIAQECKIANDYVPTYIEKVNNFALNGLLSEPEVKKALEHYTKSIVIFGFIQEIKMDTLTDDMLISKIKERCERK